MHETRQFEEKLLLRINGIIDNKKQLIEFKGDFIHDKTKVETFIGCNFLKRLMLLFVENTSCVDFNQASFSCFPRYSFSGLGLSQHRPQRDGKIKII